MTLTALAPHRTHHSVLAAIPDLVGFAPRESLVLVPFRGGRATGALRFDLPEGDATTCARAFLGALGRFGRAESVVAVLYRDRVAAPSDHAFADALASAARHVRIDAFDVVIVSGSPGGQRSRPPVQAGPREGTERQLLPDVPRDDVLAVGAQVDALLDRHPRAELPAPVRASVDALLRRAAAGSRGELRHAALAALIVCAQRPGWCRHALRIVSAGTRTPSGELLALVGAAAVSAPATERVPVLVVFASLSWAAGRRDDAVRLAAWAARSDPHDPDARALVCALQQSAEAPWRSSADRAA
ncbi:DUF4192 family protein [Rathayibacter sp. VKM Ac-2754]|uniref:DUF4192 family protein n=1 Tax=Rathayibacter sp. VKM Ac-2754 TaxID=2609251 RepID=UPI001359C2C1|nr:DUF4192 family protein [Rathayibacter sp. VKM Ac-2754]MWV60613.1 DUF4192 family protein [Rathayibacter sp. VKM Ac-2754]